MMKQMLTEKNQQLARITFSMMIPSSRMIPIPCLSNAAKSSNVFMLGFIFGTVK